MLCWDIKSLSTLFPFQLHVPVTKFSVTVPLVNAEVNKFVSIAAIKAISFSKENFYSRLFLVLKKEGSYRPVIEVSWLYNFVETAHFQMVNISCLKTLLRRGDFMTCIDLRMLTSLSTYTSPLKSTCVSNEKQMLCLSKAYHLG